MTEEELKKATGQELIDERDYCGRDSYYREYLDSVNVEMLKRFNRLAELEDKIADIKANCDLAIEGRDVKIKELEKENKDLCDNYDQFKAVAEPKIERLKKENAELKEELKDANEKVVHLACNQNKDLKYKLTKATEIIKQLLLLPYANNEEVYADVTSTLNKAEQFIKEVEK